MATRSAGILLYRLDGTGGVSAFVVHMGGPYWAKKDEGAWSIPKGELDDGEPALDAARREFREELGVDAPEVDYAELGTFPYSSGKQVTVFVADGAAFAASDFAFGEFEMEWPPRRMDAAGTGGRVGREGAAARVRAARRVAGRAGALSIRGRIVSAAR